MESYLIDWLSLLGRWLHMITGIAWIGASFYFVWLDNHLQTPKDSGDIDRGVAGEIWSIHGGGFYHAQKYKLAPDKLPSQLHWFKWEAYTTWLSGIFLMILIYWYGAEIYTIDPSTMALKKSTAIIIGVLTLIAGWLIYDLLCKSLKNSTILSISLLLFLIVMAYFLCNVFSGRGAYMHFGAMLGTIMVANVFFTIIPAQKELVNAATNKLALNQASAVNAKQRSVHNTYFTLPVLFVMISSHYAMTYGNQYNWIILIAMTIAGALIRYYFVQRHFNKTSPLPIIAAIVILLGCIFAMTPKALTNPKTEISSIEQQFANVKQIIDKRCASCHSQTPSQPGFNVAPNGIVFDTTDQIVDQAQTINQQTVLTNTMPIGNLTKMTDEERQIIGQWFEDGAKIK